MAENSIEEKIRKRYLEEYKLRSERDERIYLFNELINEVENAHDDNLAKYSLFFKGMIFVLQGSYYEAIYSFEESLKIDNNFSFSNHGLGYAYRELGEYGMSEIHYEKAFELDGTFTHPLIGLGFLYTEINRYDDAEEHYKKAILLDKTDANALNNLCRLYYDQQNYEEAIKCFEKAIEIDDKFAYPWCNLGDIFTEKRNYVEAEECYKKAITLDENIVYPWFNLALLFKETKEYAKAIYNFKKAKKLFIKEKDFDYVSMIDEQLIEIESLIEVCSEIDKADPVLVKVLKKTSTYEDDILKEKEEFLRFIKDPPEDENNNYLQVLRRWNSYTPIIADNYHVSKGGGYFLKINNTGIVIDPGFNFIDNFKGAKHKFSEIDYVLISHAHNDHTSDLESIINLLHNYNEDVKGLNDYIRTDTIRGKLAKLKGVTHKRISKEAIEKKFKESDKKKVIHFYISQSVNKKFSGMLDLCSKMNFDIHVIEENDEKLLIKEKNSKTKGDIIIKVIKAKHSDIISDRHSVGFVIEIDNRVLVYTGDTGWNIEIEDVYKKLAEDYKNTPVILLAHLGGIESYENTYIGSIKQHKRTIKKNDPFEHFYKNHLGRLGLGSLIQTLKPKLCIISEFGEEMKYTREKFAQDYNDIFEGTLFLPADIGLKYNFTQDKIEAITKINIKGTNASEFKEYGKKYVTATDAGVTMLSYCSPLLKFKHYEKGYISASDVGVIMLLEDSSLHYFDKTIGLIKSNLAQVLTREYNDRVK